MGPAIEEPIRYSIEFDGPAAGYLEQWLDIPVPPGASRSLSVQAFDTEDQEIASGSVDDITVAVGDFTDVTVQVYPTMGAISGVVTNEDTGAPVASVSVRVGKKVTLTDASGSYTLSGMKPGVAVVAFSGDAVLPATRSAYVARGWIASGISASLATKHWLPQQSPVWTNFWSVQAVSDTEAWACGDNGVVLHTVTGRDWQVVAFPSKATVHDVHFVTTSRGYAIADDGLYVTNDAGQHWTVKRSLKGLSMAVLDADTVLVGASDSVGVKLTLDAGQSTASVANLDPPPRLDGLQAISLQTLVGYDSSAGKVWISQTGGGRWNPPVTPETPTSRFSISSLSTRGVLADTRYHLLAVGRLKEDERAGVLETFDGGSTWSLVVSDSDSSYLWGIGRFGEAGLCAVGGSVAFIKEHPRAEWVRYPVDGYLSAVSFFGKSGWAVGSFGGIFRY